MFNRIFINNGIPNSTVINDTFTLYKKVSEQYRNQDILEYVRQLVPKGILNNSVIENEEPLKLVLQWFKNDFMKWTPKDPKCEKCNTLGLPMRFELINGNSWKLRKIETYT
ncbi:MAG: hypothetical protein M3156_03605, partial [Thermoproteota archaeon]|nr:hypothetical protein [Thermoproteota archaeon]